MKSHKNNFRTFVKKEPEPPISFRPTNENRAYLKSAGGSQTDTINDALKAKLDGRNQAQDIVDMKDLIASLALKVEQLMEIVESNNEITTRVYALQIENSEKLNYATSVE